MRRDQQLQTQYKYYNLTNSDVRTAVQDFFLVDDTVNSQRKSETEKKDSPSRGPSHVLDEFFLKRCDHPCPLFIKLVIKN